MRRLTALLFAVASIAAAAAAPVSATSIEFEYLLGTALQGGCTIVDKASDTTIKCLDVLAYVQHGSYATIVGHAEQDGVTTLYRISVVDTGERGSGPADLVTITTAAGCLASGSVTSGDVQVR